MVTGRVGATEKILGGGVSVLLSTSAVWAATSRWDELSTTMSKSDTSAEQYLGIAVVTAGLLVILSGFLVLGYQGVLWLKVGYWTPFSIREVRSLFDGGPPIADPIFAWQGVRKIAAWVLDCPLCTGFFVAGLGLGYFGFALLEEGRSAATRSKST
jgi:hypothetical protein